MTMTSGPVGARFMIVGEAPGEQEILKKVPFVGYSGQLLDSSLAAAGIPRSDARVLNVCNERPPGNDMKLWMPETKKAQAELLASGKGVELNGRIVHRYVKEGYDLLQSELATGPAPDVILAVGNTALWALCGRMGISNWRGSHLEHPCGAIVVPTLHPAAVLRAWDQKPAFLTDIKRAGRILREGNHPPIWHFTVRPSFAQVELCLRNLIEIADNHAGVLLLSADIETRAQHTTCVGIAWTTTDAICIPFTSVESPDGYWTEDQEVQIIGLLLRLLTHRRVEVVGQNFIYDAQYFFRHWHFVPNLKHDTMLAQHVCFPRLPKSLDFIASLYCSHYIYWKDDGKDWRGDNDEERYWRYNCEDCVRTLECHLALQGVVHRMGLDDPYAFQMSMWRPCLNMMIRGVDISDTFYQRTKAELASHAKTRQIHVEYMVGHSLNPRSNPQMQRFFYEEMGLPRQFTRGKTKAITCNDEALAKLAKKEPIVKPICVAIQEIRSCAQLLSNALKPAVGWDGKMHSSFNPAGTTTFRLSSSTDAFGSGMNLQNITSGDE